MDKQKALETLKDIASKLRLFEGVIELLEWDQQVYMPNSGATGRGKQMSLLTNQSIDLLVSKETKTTLDALESEPLEGIDKGVYRIIRRMYDKKVNVPKELELELADTAVTAHHIWAKAKEENDWKSFEPQLQKIVDLKIQISEAVGYEDSPYDVCLDDFEEGMNEKTLDRLFGDLRKDLVSLVEKIQSSPKKNDPSVLTGKFDLDRQKELNENVMELLRYKEAVGRIDESAHPFTVGVGPQDARITTHYDEHDFTKSLYATIHETGHALYELGFAKELYFTGLDTGTSLGIHESQSRFWENIVGRSEYFWDVFYPILDKHFPREAKKHSKQDYFEAVNAVQPSFIRIYADEVTYNLHIIIRYELEKQLLKKTLNVSDLPEAWNEKYTESLGVTPKTDTEGVLQDVHWSSGYIGYFPTYALGNLYSAQFLEELKQDVPQYTDAIESGNMESILSWLRENIHSKGSLLSPRQLLKEVTGEKLSSQKYIEYLTQKYSKIYNL